MTHAEMLESRSIVMRRNGCYWVEPAEFCRLAVSNLPLTRCDDLAAGLKGLVNQDTGERFLVDSNKLTRYQATDN